MLESVFVSGTTFRVLKFGQRITNADGGSDDDSHARGAGRGRGRGGRGRGRGRGGAGGAGAGKRTTVTLKQLIDAGLIEAGAGTLEMTHRGTTYAADLTPAGKVAAEGKEFASAGAFSLHVKRKTQPGKARDDGWKSVKYRGLPLEHYRKQHVDSARGPQQARGGRRAGDSGDEEMDEDAAPEGAGRGEEAQQGDAPAPAEEDVKWVCCERCQEWRVVPGAHYATIEAAGDAPWFCEMATWDVRTTVPFKPACRG